MKRTQPKWQREMLNLEIKPTFVVLGFNEAGYIRAVTPEQAQQDAERLKAMDDQAIDQYMTEAKVIRSKNRRLLGKRAMDAMSMLFAWAIKTGCCDYGDLLSPDDQRDMLEWFYDEALGGIRQGEFKKKRYDTTDKAYLWIESKMVRFHKKHGIPNDQRLSPKLYREFWTPIKKTKRWQRLVKQHGGNDDALRRAVNRCWDKEYKKNAGVT